MKKAKWNRLLLGLTLSLCLVLGSTFTASAAEQLPDPSKYKTEAFYYYPAYSIGQIRLKFPNGTKFSNIKTTSGLYAAKDTQDGQLYLVIRTLKACKGTVKFTAKLGSQKKNYKINATAVKYKNPLKTFKIGSKSYKSALDKHDKGYTSTKTVSGKLKLSLKSGYTLELVAILDLNDSSKSIAVKSGSNIKVKKGHALAMLYKDKNGNEFVSGLINV